MKAMLLEEWGKPLRLGEASDPTPGPGQAVVRVRACGVCGTDLKLISGQHMVSSRVKLPHVLGHEVAGEVAQVGPGGTGLKPGDRVVMSMYANCGECFYCQKGQVTLCSNLRAWIGFDTPGGMAEYVLAPAANLVPIAPEVPFEQAAICGDAVSTALRAVRQRGGIQAGQTVLITGCGGVGIHAVQAAHALGARVFASDVAADQMEAARKFGADATIPAGKGLREAVRELTGGRGVDVALDFAGHAGAQRAAALSVRPGGRVVLVGYSLDGDFAMPAQTLVLQEIEVVGSRAYSTANLAETMQWVADGRLKPVVERVYPLAEANQALEAIRSGQARGRQVLLV